MGPLAALLDLLYPPRCAFCRALTDRKEPVCARCRETLPFTAGGGERRGRFFSRCVAPLYYGDTVRASLHRYKFGGRAGYAAAYAPLVARCVREHLEEGYDLLSWVPLSRERLRERGYDQARLLAEAVAPLLGCVATPVLEKCRDVPRQSAAGPAGKRWANVAGAYRAPDPAAVAGRRILLIDDIVTTGATLDECARTLRAAGAKAVVCAAVARARD